MIENTLAMEGQISGDTRLLAYFTQLTNQWLRIAGLFAWKTDKNWVFDDTNQTTFPRYHTDVIDAQADYEIPTGVLNLRQVEVKNTSGDYYTLKFIHEDSPLLRNQKGQETKSSPTRYRLNGNSIILYPKPDTGQVTASEGLRITVDRDISEFATSDTTKEPGIPKALRPILYYGPAFEYGSLKGMDNVVRVCTQMLGNFPGLNDLLKEHYASRNKDYETRIIRKYKTYK